MHPSTQLNLTRGEIEAPSGTYGAASLMKHRVTEPSLGNQAKLMNGFV